jgi:hypothetical protein
LNTIRVDGVLVDIHSENIYDKVSYCKRLNEVANTNLQKVFELILNTTVKNKVLQKELPSTIYIILDLVLCSYIKDVSQTIFVNVLL